MNEATYWAGVAWVERCKPEYIMLNRLKRGYTKISIIYLTRILAEIGETPRHEVTTEPENDKVDRLNPEFVKICTLISALLGRRRSLSNTFHDVRPGVDADLQRANISDDIRNVQKQISVALKRKRHFERTGEIIQVKEMESGEELEGVALARAYQAAGKRKSYALKQVKKWAGSEHPNSAKHLANWEEKLKTEVNEFDRLSKAFRETAV